MTQLPTVQHASVLAGKERLWNSLPDMCAVYFLLALCFLNLKLTLKSGSEVVAIALAIAGYFYLMQIETPCEANPKMVMNGYCDVETQEKQ